MDSGHANGNFLPKKMNDTAYQMKQRASPMVENVLVSGCRSKGYSEICATLFHTNGYIKLCWLETLFLTNMKILLGVDHFSIQPEMRSNAAMCSLQLTANSTVALRGIKHCSCSIYKLVHFYAIFLFANILQFKYSSTLLFQRAVTVSGHAPKRCIIYQWWCRIALKQRNNNCTNLLYLSGKATKLFTNKTFSSIFTNR